MYFLEAKQLFPSTITLFESNIHLIFLLWKGGWMGRQEQNLNLHFPSCLSPPSAALSYTSPWGSVLGEARDSGVLDAKDNLFLSLWPDLGSL